MFGLIVFTKVGIDDTNLKLFYMRAYASGLSSDEVLIVGSNPTALNMGEYQSGQMGRPVKPLSVTSVVRIHPLPPIYN